MKYMTGNRGTSPPPRATSPRPYFPHNFTDHELGILSFLLGGYTSKSIPCRVQFRCVCFLLREDRAGSREPGPWAGVPWDLGSDVLLGQGRDPSLVQDPEGEPPGRASLGRGGFRLHCMARPPLSPKEPGSPTARRSGLCLHPCQVSGAP